jgi:membrane-bound lytic murein transglycosylase B
VDTVPTTLPPTTSPSAPPLPPPTTTGTTAPPDARQLASELAKAEKLIRDPKSTPAQISAAGEAQQLAYRPLASDAALRTAVAAAVPASIRDAVNANAAAVAELASMTGRLKDHPPAWRIVTPPPPDELLTYYKEAAQQEGVPWEVLASIHLIETRMGRIRGVSTAGAQGPMQFLPSTWVRYGNGGDINDNRDAIFGAARLLRSNGGDRGDMRAAVYSYNHSQHYVNAVLGFAAVMQDDERAYLGYHAWQVFYRTTGGDVLLPEGYGS